MSAAKITSKGQITIPQDVRERMGVSEGDRVEFIQMDDGGFVVKPINRSIKDLEGIIPRPKKPVTLEDMQAAIIAGATKGYKVRRKAKKK